GAIRVSSAPGEGSILKVFLPVSDANYPGRPERAEWTSKGTILVIDDEDMVRKVAKLTLENHGYRVLLAGNGKAAIDLFRDMSSSVALIVLDVTMPIMSGEEAFQHLRSIRSGVPVLLSSGHNESDVMTRFLDVDLAGRVQKPYTPVQLRQRVHGALAHRSQDKLA